MCKWISNATRLVCSTQKSFTSGNSQECSVYTSLISVKVLRSVDKLIEVCVFTYMYLGTLASEFKAKQTIELNVNT